MLRWKTGTAGRIQGVAMTAAAFLLISVITFLDFLTGGLSFSIFYLVPIYLATWHIGRASGVVFSLLSAAGWLTADLVTEPAYIHPLTPLWNMLVRLGFFLLTVYLISSLQRTEQQRRALEEIFFHDILNIVGSIRGFAELLRAYPDVDREQIYALLQSAADQSIEEIENQRTLSALEHRELALDLEPLNSLELVRQMSALYLHHPRARDRHLLVSGDSEEFEFTSDRTLIQRILGNLLKNALEASVPGETVTIGVSARAGGVEFRVHNRAVIPAAVRPRIFSKGASTRGSRRGYGTWSIAMLSRLLQGRVHFTSSEEEGTTFHVWLPLGPPAVGQGKDHSRQAD